MGRGGQCPQDSPKFAKMTHYLSLQFLMPWISVKFSELRYFPLHLHVGKHASIGSFLHLQFLLQPVRHPHFLKQVFCRMLPRASRSYQTHHHTVFPSTKSSPRYSESRQILMVNVVSPYMACNICCSMNMQNEGILCKRRRFYIKPQFLKISSLGTLIDAEISTSGLYSFMIKASTVFRSISERGNGGELLCHKCRRCRWSS